MQSSHYSGIDVNFHQTNRKEFFFSNWINKIFMFTSIKSLFKDFSSSFYAFLKEILTILIK